jgi:hypothetical protein
MAVEMPLFCLWINLDLLFQKYAEIMQTWACHPSASTEPYHIMSQASVSIFNGHFSSELA